MNAHDQESIQHFIGKQQLQVAVIMHWRKKAALLRQRAHGRPESSMRLPRLHCCIDDDGLTAPIVRIRPVACDNSNSKTSSSISQSVTSMPPSLHHLEEPSDRSSSPVQLSKSSQGKDLVCTKLQQARLRRMVCSKTRHTGKRGRSLAAWLWWQSLQCHR